jgi:putative tryptophan/tyrosine transport system substrate-binding protein
MRRREFITLLGGAAAWPLAARAQQAERMRRIGVLMAVAADNPEEQARLAAFHQELGQLGWVIGRNAMIAIRWAAGDAKRMRNYATELLALAPDVILATSGTILPALLDATRTVPIVFVQVADPVGAGFVASLAHPGGNVTGFLAFEYGLSGKWAGVAQADHTQHDARGRPSRSRRSRRDRPVWCICNPQHRHSEWS